jgi:gliding motility-associated-like protein
MKKNLLLFVFLLSISSLVHANIYTVTVANQTGWCGGAGTFVNAVCQASANPGRDTIEFNLPGNTNILSWGPTITASDNNLFINGLSKIDGNPVVFNHQLSITGSFVDLYGIKFETSLHSLAISGSNNSVDSCFFTVTGDGQNAVWLNGGTNSVVKNSIVNSSKLHGISIENGGSHLIENCTVLNSNDVGIIIRGTGNNIVRKCKVSNGKHNGIGLISGNNIVEYCESFDNDRAGIVADNTLGGCTDNIIRNNKIYNNNLNYWLNAQNKPTPDQAGIQSNGPRTIILNNWVYGNAGNGILVNKLANVSGASNSVISNNIVGRDSLGNENGNQWNGIFAWEANNVTVENNIVVNNGGGVLHDANSSSLNHMPDRVSGIRFQEVSSGNILTNFIGTDITKKAVGNAFDGITLHTNVSNVNIIGNIINNNGFNSVYGAGGGIALRNSANTNVISSNFIGMHPDSTDGGNNDYGIAVEVGSGNIIGGDNPFLGNVIANSKNAVGRGVGIWLVLLGNTNNSVFNNLITNHVNDGVLIERGARNNIIGNPTRGNIISNNKNGVLVRRGLEWDNSRGATTFGNNFRSNSFVCNTNQGILLTDDGNDLYGKPSGVKTILFESNEKRVNFISGYAPSASAVVDIYVKDTLCRVDCDNNASQGALFVTSVTASNTASTNGLFMWEFDLTSPSNVGNVVTKSNAIVMATQAGSNPVPNSSEFSTCTPEITCVTPTNISINGDNIVCTGGNTLLTANADDLTIGEDYIYTWYRGSVIPSNIIATNTNQNTLNINTVGDYFVVIANTLDSAGCSDVNATPFNFNIAQTPTDVNITGDNSVCTGESSILTANGTIDNNTTHNYEWYRNSISPANLISGANSSTLTATQSGDYFVVVSNSLNTSCKDSNNTAFTLTVNQTPSNISISGDDNVCTGENSLLTANATIDNNVTHTYSWYSSSVSPANLIPNNNTNTLSVNQTGNYFVVITNDVDNNCRDTVETPFNFNVTQTPSNTSISGDNAACTGESKVLTAIADIDNTAINSYAWYRNSVDGGNLIIESTNNTLTVDEAGTYFVVVINGNKTECRDTINDPFTFDINPIPAVEILQNDTVICVRKNETVNVTVTTTATNPTIVWSNGLAANQLTNTVAQAPIYLVATVTDENNCSDTAGIRIGVECPPLDAKLPNVFIPNGQNPRNTVFTPIVEPGEQLDGNILKSHLEIYNRWGVKMYETEELVPVWDGKFNGRAVPAGTYFWIWKYTDLSDINYNKNGFVQALDAN